MTFGPDLCMFRLVTAAQRELAVAIADRDAISKRMIAESQDFGEQIGNLKRKRKLVVLLTICLRKCFEYMIEPASSSP